MIRAIVPCALALALAGCGVGAGAGTDEVDLLVTRDRGATRIGAVPGARAPGSETVMRMLQRNFDVSTRYGGGFVQAIEGVSGGRRGGRPVDWFFYVNGVEAPEGAAATEVRKGDRIWWDHHDWGAAQRSPAVVGSYPEPFVHGFGGKRRPVRVECPPDGDDGACDIVAERIGEEGVIAAKALVGVEGGENTLRVLVGPWDVLRRELPARNVERGPAASGVFARFAEGGRSLELLDERGRARRTLGAGAGLVAATRIGDDAPTWFVTGTDPAGVRAAANALEPDALGGRFAVAIDGGRPVALPVRP